MRAELLDFLPVLALPGADILAVLPVKTMAVSMPQNEQNRVFKSLAWYTIARAIRRLQDSKPGELYFGPASVFGVA